MPDADDAPEGFKWDAEKASVNLRKHGVGFHEAVRVWDDPAFLVATDEMHSAMEERLFAIGMVDRRVLTVRFTYRGAKRRLIGAGEWRKGRKLYARR